MENIEVLQNDLKNLLETIIKMYMQSHDTELFGVYKAAEKVYSKHFQIEQGGAIVDKQNDNADKWRLEYTTSKYGHKYYYLVRMENGKKKTKYIGNGKRLKSFVENNQYFSRYLQAESSS